MLQPLNVEHGIHPVGHQVGLFEDVGYHLAPPGRRMAVLTRLSLEELGVRLDDRNRRPELVNHEPDKALAGPRIVVERLSMRLREQGA